MDNPYPVKANWLAYVDNLGRRALTDITTVVIHCTETPDLRAAREYGERIHYNESQTGNSGHFYIDRDGLTEQWVPLERVAHHVSDLNHDAIGIELVNCGRWPDWFHSQRQQPDQAYPAVQINALIQLLNTLASDLHTLKTISGHEHLDTRMMPASDNPDITIRRKIDPGPLFPWATVLDAITLQLKHS